MTQETTPMEPAPDAPVTTSAAPPAPNLTQKLAAEVIGTFILVLIGCGAVVFGAEGLRSQTSISTITTIGLAFGLAIVLSVYAFGRISGGHFNPAVSAGAAISGRISWLEAGYYMVAQVIGAILGALVLWIVAHGFPNFDSTVQGLGANHFGNGAYSWWAAFILELVLTALFVFIILAVTDTRNEHPALAPLAIGLTLAAIHFVAIPATGTSVNPARSIGPALFSGTDAMADLWLFIVAPFLGGLAAGVGYPALFGRTDEPVPGSGFRLSFARPGAAPVWSAPDQFQQQWNQQEGWAQPAPHEGWGRPTAEQAAAYQPPAPQSEPAAQTQVTGQSWQQPVAPATEGELPVYEQDGWRWDYAKQQWVPIEQHGDQPPSQG